MRLRGGWATLVVVLLAVGMLSLPLLIDEFETWRAVRDYQLETRPAPGDHPARFDPLAGYAVARALAGDDADLISVQMELIRSDGTMDLAADLPTRPRTVYTFTRPARQPPATVLPVGAGGSLTGAWYERVTVYALKPNHLPALLWGITSGRRRWSTYGNAREIVNKGLIREVDRPRSDPPTQVVPPPACPLPLLWQTAITRGAPPTALAQISYGPRGYQFEIKGTPIAVAFGPDCQPLR